MRPRKIGKFQVYKLENYLVIGLTSDWMKFFKNNPVFEVEINREGRLILKGPKIVGGIHEE